MKKFLLSALLAIAAIAAPAATSFVVTNDSPYNVNLYLAISNSPGSYSVADGTNTPQAKAVTLSDSGTFSLIAIQATNSTLARVVVGASTNLSHLLTNYFTWVIVPANLSATVPSSPSNSINGTTNGPTAPVPSYVTTQTLPSQIAYIGAPTNHDASYFTNSLPIDPNWNLESHRVPEYMFTTYYDDNNQPYETNILKEVPMILTNGLIPLDVDEIDDGYYLAIRDLNGNPQVDTNKFLYHQGWNGLQWIANWNRTNQFRPMKTYVWMDRPGGGSIWAGDHEFGDILWLALSNNVDGAQVDRTGTSWTLIGGNTNWWTFEQNSIRSWSEGYQAVEYLYRLTNSTIASAGTNYFSQFMGHSSPFSLNMTADDGLGGVGNLVSGQVTMIAPYPPIQVGDPAASWNGSSLSAGDASKEVAWEVWWDSVTNLFKYVRPGHYIQFGTIALNNGTGESGFTNVFWMSSMVCGDIFFTHMNWNNHPFGAITNTYCKSLIYQDPLGKTGFLIDTNNNLWKIRKELVGNQYALVFWAHGTNSAANISGLSLNLRSYFPSLLASSSSFDVVAYDPFQKADVATNSMSVTMTPGTMYGVVLRIQLHAPTVADYAATNTINDIVYPAGVTSWTNSGVSITVPPGKWKLDGLISMSTDGGTAGVACAITNYPGDVGIVYTSSGSSPAVDRINGVGLKTLIWSGAATTGYSYYRLEFSNTTTNTYWLLVKAPNGTDLSNHIHINMVSMTATPLQF